MLTLRQLMMTTPKNIRQNIRGCRIRVVTAFEGNDDNGKYKEVHMQVGCTTDPRLVRYRFYGPSGSSLATYIDEPLWVHCSCEYFTYYIEVALAARGSSTVLDSNGNFPRIRNPKFVPHLCKHAYFAARPATVVQPKLQQVAAAVVSRRRNQYIGRRKHQLPPDIKKLLKP